MKVGSKLIAFFLIILCISGPANAIDGAAACVDCSQKLQGEGNDVRFAYNGVVMNFEGDVCEIAAIYFDGRDAYISEDGIDAEKEYIMPEQIVISSEGIFVINGKESFQISAIMRDHAGLYYLRRSIYWTCKNCRTANPAWRNTCKNCKKPYRG